MAAAVTDLHSSAVWLNTGSGFAGPVQARRPPTAIWDGIKRRRSSPTRNSATASRLRRLLPGDGGSVLQTYLNTGAGWARRGGVDMPYVFAWTYAAGKNRMTGQLVDVNGDGFPTSFAHSTRHRTSGSSMPGSTRATTFPDASDSGVRTADAHLELRAELRPRRAPRSPTSTATVSRI